MQTRYDINSATTEDLLTVSGMTPALVEGIISARPFTALDELLVVDGMNEALLASMRDALEVNAPAADSPNQQRPDPSGTGGR